MKYAVIVLQKLLWTYILEHPENDILASKGQGIVFLTNLVPFFSFLSFSFLVFLFGWGRGDGCAAFYLFC
jgi:hypothetical protein